jgi:Glyoxalase/Bleomycin resistance protein/Dioxygenase superfamily
MLRLELIVHTVRSLNRSIQFFEKGCGFNVERVSSDFAQVSVPLSSARAHSSTVAFALQERVEQDNEEREEAEEREKDDSAHNLKLTPLFTFSVHNLDEVLPRLLQQGASMCGPVQHEHDGQYATVIALDNIAFHLVSPIAFEGEQATERIDGL